jgi:hypothetical protein
VYTQRNADHRIESTKQTLTNVPAGTFLSTISLVQPNANDTAATFVVGGTLYDPNYKAHSAKLFYGVTDGRQKQENVSLTEFSLTQQAAYFPTTVDSVDPFTPSSILTIAI